jgi:two-component system, chemotaxis family, chemotaxis protein CheY
MAFSILIVDDSNMMRKSLRKTLDMSGLTLGEILEAADGSQALDTVRERWVDLVFLDINMPIMDGIEFLKNVRADAMLKDLAVVVISTEGSEERVQELKELGVKAYLRKPVRPEQVAETVKLLLS